MSFMIKASNRSIRCNLKQPFFITNVYNTEDINYEILNL